MSEQVQANGNGATATVIKTTCIDSAKERFKARKSPATEKEVMVAWKGYFSAHDAVLVAQRGLAEAQAARTQAAKELVSTRGNAQQKIAGRGLGRFMCRGDSAWILFPGEDDGPELTIK